MAAATSTRLISPESSVTRPVVALIVATAGYGVTFGAWTLIGPLGLAPALWSGIGDSALTLLAAEAVVIGSLGCVPVGILTDRYGARVVFPAISVLAALPVLALATVDSGPALVAAAGALGVAGMAFATGSAVVIRAYPPARRGLALSIFGAGMGVASAAALVSRQFFAVDRRGALPLLALALVGHAVLAAALLRDRPHRRVHRAGIWRVALDVLRLPATRHLSGWYALAFGGLVALGLYLPAYLRHAYQVNWDRATLYTAACVAVAAVNRPVGGWLCQQRDPVSLLRACFAGTGGFGLVLAFQPPLLVATPLLLGVAGCLGMASGVVQAVIGATAPPERAGSIAGTIGAVGGLAGLLPPLLLAAVYGINGSYGIGLTILAGAALGGAAYLSIHGRWIGAALAFPATIAGRHTGTTVVALSVAHNRPPTHHRSSPHSPPWRPVMNWSSPASPTGPPPPPTSTRSSPDYACICPGTTSSRSLSAPMRTHTKQLWSLISWPMERCPSFSP